MTHLVFIIGLAHVIIDVDGVVRGGVHIDSRILLLFAAGNATAEAPFELLPRVVGMVGVCWSECGVAMCASSSCGVCDLLCVHTVGGPI